MSLKLKVLKQLSKKFLLTILYIEFHTFKMILFVCRLEVDSNSARKIY